MTKTRVIAGFAALLICLSLIGADFARELTPSAAIAQVSQPSSGQTAPANPQTNTQAPNASGAAANDNPQQGSGAAVPSGQAQPATGNANGDASKDQRVEGWNRVLDGLEQALTREGIDNRELEQISDESLAISKEASTLINQLTPGVNDVQQQIDQLGPAPAEGEPAEAEGVAAKRQSLQQQLSQVDAPLREAKLVVVRADQISSAAILERRNRFLNSLAERSMSIVDPALWQETFVALPLYFDSVSLTTREAAAATAQRISANPGSFFLFLAQLAVGLVIYRLLRMWLRRRYDDPAPAAAGDAYSASTGRHLRDFMIAGVLPTAMLVFMIRMIQASPLIADRFGNLLGGSLLTWCSMLMAFGLLRVFVRPKRPDLRIADFSDSVAKGVFAAVTLGLFAAAILHVIGISVELQQAPFEVTLTVAGLFAASAGLTALRTLVVIARGDPGRTENAATEDGARRWRYMRWVLWLAVVAIFAALLFGFIALGEFLAYQLIIGMIVAGVVWLFMSWIDEAKQSSIEPDRISLASVLQKTGFGLESSRQIAVLAFGLLRLFILAAALMALLVPWGVRTSDWLALTNKAFFGFQIGEITISFSAILTALILFVIGLGITHAIQKWVANQFLPTTRLDIGLRNSIATVLGYVGFVLAAVLAVGSTGLDLSNIALVAGALSVGIGLGLQSIVNNFVSGLILLAERPIKAGDWIISTAGEGTVRRISVRSTEIETFDRATVIVPNSTLITDSLTNWTHRSKLGRIIISIGVGYGSDPDQVREILLACAEAHETVLRRPEPLVYFMDFGDSALLFDLRCWVADISESFGVKSDLRFDILRKLRAAGIEIPFPQRDLHIKSGLEKLVGDDAEDPDAEEDAPARPRRRSRQRRSSKSQYRRDSE